jgi:hypothetical protein
MIPVQTIDTRARLMLVDSASIRWTGAELLEWVNEGALELSKVHHDACTKTENVQLVAGAKQTNPTGCIDIIDVRQNVGGAAITPFNRAVMDNYSPNWMTTPTAAYVNQWCDDDHPDTFYVYPAQNVTPASVVITYYAVPTAVTSLSDNLNIRDIYATNMVNYVVSKCFSKETEQQDLAKAAAYMQQALGA